MTDTLQIDPKTQPTEDDIAHIGHSMSRMRMITGRRLVARLVIEKVAPDLELSHLDVLETVKRARENGEVTVGTIAEAMRIDPSRASRIVADMVGRGVLERAASQQDARRILVVITPSGWSLLGELKSQKLAIIQEIVSDWSSADAKNFAELFDRYMTGFERVFAMRDKHLPAAPKAGK